MPVVCLSVLESCRPSLYHLTAHGTCGTLIIIFIIEDPVEKGIHTVLTTVDTNGCSVEKDSSLLED